MEGKELYFRNINKEGKELLVIVNIDRIININRK